MGAVLCVSLACGLFMSVTKPHCLYNYHSWYYVFILVVRLRGLPIVRFDDLPCIGWCAFFVLGGVCIWVVANDFLLSWLLLLMSLVIAIVFFMCVLLACVCTVQSWVLDCVSEKMYIMDSTTDMMYTYDRTCGIRKKNLRDYILFTFFFLINIRVDKHDLSI
jgi:hypothetical protein